MEVMFIMVPCLSSPHGGQDLLYRIHRSHEISLYLEPDKVIGDHLSGSAGMHSGIIDQNVNSSFFFKYLV